MPAKPTKPNSTAQAPSAYKAAIDAHAEACHRTATAFAPHAQDTPNMTVALAAGQLLEGTTLTEVAAQSTGTITAPVTHPRIDRVVIDRATGAASVVAGTEAASPTAPAIPTGKLPVARVALTVGQTSIVNANITDERVGGGAGVTIGTIADPSTTEVPSTQDVADAIAAIPSADTTARDNAAMTALLAQLTAGRASGPVPGGGMFTLKTDELTNSGGTYDAAGDYYGNAGGYVDETANISSIAQLNFNQGGTCTLTALRDGTLTGGCGTQDETGSSLDLIFSASKSIGKIEFYNYANTERLKAFTVRRYDSGAWTKVPITAISGGTIVNTDEGQVSNANGWVVCEFASVSDTQFRLAFTSVWGIGDANAYLPEAKIYSLAGAANMTLTSAAVALGQVPTKATLYLLHKAVDATTLNTDIKASVSRGDGWAEATDLAVLCQFDADYKLLRATVDLSALGSGSSASWRVQTYNAKSQRVRAALLWAE